VSPITPKIFSQNRHAQHVAVIVPFDDIARQISSQIPERPQIRGSNLFGEKFAEIV
jgi:hypothetical protein